MVKPDSIGLYHPTTDDEVSVLVRYALSNQLQVRVRGAAQSVTAAIYADQFDPTVMPPAIGNNINIMLNQMRSVAFDDEKMQVTVGAGCNLGYDPNDPSLADGQPEHSTKKNSLFHLLAKKKYAIPNMSDAIHQTVAGFISTGSSGGSVAHSFLGAVVAIKLVDGLGAVRIFTKPNPDKADDVFYAAGVSLGLLGVVTEVTLQCIPAFDIIGTQSITTDSAAPMDFFDQGIAGLPSLENYLSSTEFTRLMWWPYPTVKRLVSWQARTMKASDYNQQTGTQEHFIPQPYKDVFPVFFGSQIPSEFLADCFFTMIGNWPQVLTDLLGNSITIGDKTIPTSTLQLAIDVLWPKLLPFMLNVYFPLDNGKPPQEFWDTWNHGLPMDSTEYSNNLFPAYHTEFWVPLSQTKQVMTVLNNYYTNDYLRKSDPANNNYANGCYVVEVFGAKSTGFWLSPSYNQDSLRINLFSFQHTQENVSAYYQQFWELFAKNKIDFRLHWGYFLPPPPGNQGASFVTGQYPMWKQFTDLRKTMDPHDVFLSSYWSSQLNIERGNS